MGRENDRILGHADEADGIDEYDNPMPAWWLGLFYFCVIWGVGYGIHYHFIGARSQASEYDAEVAAALEQWPEVSAEDAVVAEVTDDVVDAGKKIYTTNCLPCHGADLTGGIGPNLVDAEWVHGAELSDITKVVMDGVLEKGMPAWGPVLGPEKVGQVAAYVQSAGGS